MKARYQISYYLRIVLTVIIYILFYGYIIYSCIHATSKEAILFNIIIGAFGLIGLLFEYLRICYDSATKKLIVEGKPDQALELLKKVEKLDILKTFKTSCQMMKMLAMIDLRQYDEFRAYSKELETNNYDVEIVRKYCEMMAEGECGNKGRSNEAFKQLTKIRDMRDKKGRRNKGAYYFNWEVVNGQHKNYERDYQGALRYLRDIDESNMNMREIMHYQLALALAAKHCGETEIYETARKRLDTICANNPVMKAYCETL